MNAPVRQTRRKRRWGQRGQALAEFAIILPLFLVLFLGIVEFSRLFHAWVTVQHSAREAVRYAVTGRDDRVPGDRLASIQDVALNQTSILPGEPVVTVRSREDASVPTFTEDDPGGPCDQIEVEVDYTFNLLFPIFGTTPTVELDATERMVAEAFDECDE